MAQPEDGATHGAPEAISAHVFLPQANPSSTGVVTWLWPPGEPCTGRSSGS